MVSRVGCDEEGDEILALMDARGMDTRFIQRDDTRPTGRVEVTLSPSGEPTYRIVEGVAWDAIASDDSLARILNGCDAICFGTLAQRSGTSRVAIRKMLQAADRAVKVFDVNLRQHFFSDDILADGLRVAHIVKLNEDEMDTLLRTFAGDAQGSASGLAAAFGIELLAVTQGARGCSLYRGGEYVTVPGVRVQVEDTVGSGDAFTASLILSFLDGKGLAETGREANRLGAFVATQPGDTPDIAGYRERLAGAGQPPTG